MDSSTETNDFARTAQRPRALPVLGAVLLCVVGLVLTVSSLGSEPGLAVFGVLLLGLGACSALTQLLRGRQGGRRRQGVSAPGDEPVVATSSSPEGGAVVSVVGRSSTLLVACAAISWVALCAAAGGVVAFGSGNPTVGVVLLAVAVIAAGYLVIPVARGMRSATVELTPEWLAAERFGARWQVPWTEVSGSVPPRSPGQPLAVVVHATATVTRKSGWPGWPNADTAPQGVLTIPVDDLPVYPEVLARVIALCADDPTLRAQLGSPGSADWTRWPPGPTQPHS